MPLRIYSCAMVLSLQPFAFFRAAWKKWELKRSGSDKGNTLSTHSFWPSPRRSRAYRHRRTSNISSPTLLPKPSSISFEDYTRPVLASHRWISIQRRHSSSTVNERTYAEEKPTALCDNQRDEHLPPKGSSRYHASHPRLASLKLLPVLDSDNHDGVRLSIVEKPSTDVVRQRRARTTSRTTRLAIVSELPTGNAKHSSPPPPPPPLLVRKKVPKPLILRPLHDRRTSSSLVTPTSSPRPGSQRSPSQASFSSLSKKSVGRPLAGLPPPPTSPPNTPLPSPPVDIRRDSNLSFSAPSIGTTGKCRFTASQVAKYCRNNLESRW